VLTDRQTDRQTNTQIDTTENNTTLAARLVNILDLCLNVKAIRATFDTSNIVTNNSYTC